MSHPEFIDNIEGNTLASALEEALDRLQACSSDGETQPTSGELSVATGFFSPSGFAQVADALRGIPQVRLLIGVDLAGKEMFSRPNLGEKIDQFEQRKMRDRLKEMDAAMCAERDHTPFSRSSSVALRQLISALRSGNLEIRRYETSFLHAKAYIFTDRGTTGFGKSGIIAGSSNLTKAGLLTNLEVNLGRYDHPVVEEAQQWFDRLWEDGVPYEIADIFEQSLLAWTPWNVFLRTLYRLYGSEIEDEARRDMGLPLTNFQKHGVARALRLIQSVGGAIVADEVGLGKTFIAGEILQHYTNRRQRALLVCPAALRDSAWKQFLDEYQLYVECLSFEQLSIDVKQRDSQWPNAKGKHLVRNLDEYQLVIIDEAHNYRNPDTPARAGALRTLLFGKRRDVLMLTATPVNNSLWDLYHLMRYFIRQDAFLLNHGIRSIREQFEKAMRLDPSNLSPDLLYPIIDATTVKRTRQFVKKHYSKDDITLPDGSLTRIVFPKPIAMSIRYSIDDVGLGLFDAVENALSPDEENNDGRLTFARYNPDRFLLEGAGGETNARAQALVGLLRSGLLKRFESSMFAFHNTVEKMRREHKRFLEALGKGYVVSTAFLKEISADDEATFEDLLVDRPRPPDLEQLQDGSLFNIDGLQEAVERDEACLANLAELAAQVTPDHDPKLAVLSDALQQIAKQAKGEAISEEHEFQLRKVIVFSTFEDTVKWVSDFLKDEVSRYPELELYQGRIAAVSGSGDLNEGEWQQTVRGFAPISMGMGGGMDDDVYDLLVSTDVLAEGVNLQQCRNIINFDMPWNPMRLVQRHGRIDRIGSRHNRVYLRTVFPTDRLDRMLRLKQRILNKLAMAAASVGVAAPIEGASDGDQVFAETRAEIEKLLREDASLYERGGTVGAAQTGEEYRQTLRKALVDDPNHFDKMPWKIGSGMVKGNRRGVFFCGVVGDRTFLRFIVADDDWHVSHGDESIVREMGECLRLIECEPDTLTHIPEVLHDRVYDFWDVAQDDIYREWTEATDPANLQPQVSAFNRRVAEFIRDNRPTELSEEQVNRALDILESPWPRRDENELRRWFGDDSIAGAKHSKFLVESIIGSGLEPALPPDPLPPIVKDEVELLCWMSIEPETDGPRRG